MHSLYLHFLVFPKSFWIHLYIKYYYIIRNDIPDHEQDYGEYNEATDGDPRREFHKLFWKVKDKLGYEEYFKGDENFISRGSLVFCSD